MVQKAEEAVERKKKGYNCAQAVACTYCGYAGVGEQDMFHITQAFGAGMGTLEGTCGSLVGAGIVLGMANKDKARTVQDTRKLMNDFKERNSAVTCKTLKGIETGRILRECEDCVRDACELLEERMEEK